MNNEHKEDIKQSFSLFRLAAKNMKTYAWMNVKMCLTFACLAFLICLFTAYNVSITEQKNKMIRESASANYFRTQHLTQAESFADLCDDIIYKDIYLLHNYSSDIRLCYGWGSYDVKSSFITLYIDGEKHNAYEDIVMDTMAEPEGGYFYEYDYTSLKEIYGLDNIFSHGTNPQNPNEFAVSQSVLAAYDITPEDILGKTVTAYMKNNLNPGNDVFQFTGNVCGIIRDEYYHIPGHNANNDSSPILLFHRESDLFKQSYITEYRFYLGSWPDEETIIEWFTQFPNAYAGHNYVATIDSLVNIQYLAGQMYIIIGSMLIVSLILTIFLMIDKYMQVFSRFGGILLSIGMRQNQLSLLLFIQLVIMCAFALPLAFILTFSGYYVINTLITWVVKVSIGLSVTNIVNMLFLGIGVVILIAMLFFAYGIYHLRKKTIKQLLVATVK